MYLEYKGSKIYYIIKGKGKPILFLHGWGGSVISFKGLFDYLCNKHKCISLDFPPFGRSEEPKVPYDLYDYLNIVKIILEKNNIEKVSVVAHSFGCRVAILLSSKTNLVDKMVFTGAAGIKPKNTLKKIFRKLRYNFYKKLVKWNLLKIDRLKTFESEDYKKLSPVMKNTFKNIVNIDLKNMLEYIDAEVVLFWGEKDTETPLYMAKIMKNKIKDSCLISYKDCGHFCYLEKFYEFKKITSEFLI